MSTVNKKNILFVDDEKLFLDSMRTNLRKKKDVWNVNYCLSAIDAISMLRNYDYDLVLADMNMPGKGGLNLLEDMKRNEKTKDIPVVIITGMRDIDLKRQALEMGATDLLNKPIIFEDLIARVENSLKLKSYQDQLKMQNANLEALVKTRTSQLECSRISITLHLAKAGEYKDEDTGQHILRVGSYCRFIGEKLGYEKQLLDLLALASPLHDIGKIGIPDSILLKPGKLTDDEWSIIQSHTEIGRNILNTDISSILSLISDIDCDNLEQKEFFPVIHMASKIAYAHHEKWDGSGYPLGLSRNYIPEEARITALADVYDALRSQRPYKKPFTHEKSKDIITESIGSHFDPSIGKLFLQNHEVFESIYSKLAD